MKLLKAYFGKNHDGKWPIQSLQVIPLKGSGSNSEDFFAIEDDLLATQPSILGTIKSELGRSIVPIVAQVPGERVLRCLGTGFFITCTGLLVTAAHVVTDPIERKYGPVKEIDKKTLDFGDLKFGVMLPLNPLFQGKGYAFRSIEWAIFLAERSQNPLPIAGIDLKLTSDTAICKVSPIAEGIPHQPLSIVQSGIRGIGIAVGKIATAIGYVGMRDVELIEKGENIVAGDFCFNLHVSTGPILERFPDNLSKRHVSTPGACFSASLKLPAGMSGSPIFDHEMIYVHGVVSKGLVDDNGPANFGYGSMLAPSLGLSINRLGDKSLLELQQSEGYGFSILSMPDL